MKLQTLNEHFLFHCEVERGLAAHTVDSYRHDLNQYFEFLGGDTSVKQALTARMLKAFLSDMSRRRNLSASTVRRRLACMKSLCRYASQQFAVKNPFNEWTPKIKRNARLPRALPRSDVSFLLKPKNEDHDREVLFALLVLGVTGLRISELCALKVGDVSVDGDVIRVSGKGNRDRVVYLTHEVALKKMRERRRLRLSEAGEEAAIFVNFRGAPLRPQTLRRRLHKHASDLGYDRTVTPHMIRHTAATLLIEQGTDIRYVQRLLGHASISTTEIYTHVSNEALRNAVGAADTLGAILNVE